MTTIKVPKTLRQRISRDAAREGLTAAALIAELLDAHDREARFAAVREAYEATDAAYIVETEAWDSTSSDGLAP